MPKLDNDYRPLTDDKLAGLVRAIAAELIQLGHCPVAKPGHVLTQAKDVRIVAPDVWKAMKEIQAGREP